MHTIPRWLAAALACPMLSAQAQACSAESGPIPATVVELYTSEGCNSCPPADRWLSSLRTGPQLVALAFHVDYWNHLGWVDRYAAPAYTQRQALQQAVNGARYSYTPQVVVNGQDRKDWPRLGTPPSASTSAPVTLQLSRQAEGYTAAIQANQAMRLAAYWAVTENGLSSEVKAGENAGSTLRHDHVVRELQPVAAWMATAGSQTRLRFSPTAPPDPAHPRQVNLVVVDAATGRPVQALSLGC